MSLRTDILEIMEKDAKLTPREIAVMLGANEKEVADIIKEMEDKKIIFGYRTLINWEKADEESVSALIELKVTPQQGEGFEKIARTIIERYPGVKSVSLISGGFDLLVEIDGRSMKEIALFVAENLAPLDCILSTATHFVLRKYKQDGVVLDNKSGDERRVITL